MKRKTTCQEHNAYSCRRSSGSLSLLYGRGQLLLDQCAGGRSLPFLLGRGGGCGGGCWLLALGGRSCFLGLLSTGGLHRIYSSANVMFQLEHTSEYKLAVFKNEALRHIHKWR